MHITSDGSLLQGACNPRFDKRKQYGAGSRKEAMVKEEEYQIRN